MDSELNICEFCGSTRFWQDGIEMLCKVCGEPVEPNESEEE